MDAHNDELGLKTCSTCGQQKTLTEFYSIGSRLDAACKACQLAKKNAGYKSKATDKELARVKKVISVIFEHRMERLTTFHDQLKVLIAKAEKRAAERKRLHEGRETEI